MMNPTLISITQTVAIHWYGIMVALGAAIGLYFIERDLSKKRLVSFEQFHNLVFLCFVNGILAGKLVYLVTEDPDNLSLEGLLSFFEGGLSILGTVTAIALTIVTYLYYKQKPILPVADIVGLYAPLVQGFGRLGCLFAGCCYGLPTESWFAVTYTHPEHLAPLHIPLHPTQLYSSLLLFASALLLQLLKPYLRHPGQIGMLYLTLIGLERFVVDFWRNDRVFIALQGNSMGLSFHQLFACIIMMVGLSLFCYFSYRKSHDAF